MDLSATLSLSVVPSAIPIASDSEIVGPGTYSLQNDVARLTLDVSNVTLLGNNHKVGFLTVGGNIRYDKSGIIARDLMVGSMVGFGNLSSAQTEPALHLINITVTDNNLFPAIVYGSNMVIEQCEFVGGDQADDSCLLWNARGLADICSYVTFDRCHFGGNYDVGLEGIGGWDHVTVTNCVSSDSIGGWFGPRFAEDRALSFTLSKCIFTNNTVRTWAFADGKGDRFFAASDAEATGYWPDSTFSGNTYFF